MTKVFGCSTWPLTSKRQCTSTTLLPTPSRSMLRYTMYNQPNSVLDSAPTAIRTQDRTTLSTMPHVHPNASRAANVGPQCPQQQLSARRSKSIPQHSVRMHRQPILRRSVRRSRPTRLTMQRSHPRRPMCLLPNMSTRNDRFRRPSTWVASRRHHREK